MDANWRDFLNLEFDIENKPEDSESGEEIIESELKVKYVDLHNYLINIINDMSDDGSFKMTVSFPSYLTSAEISFKSHGL